MPYRVTKTRKFSSRVCDGVVIHLKKMTEGRRLDLRDRLKEANIKVRSILREQLTLEADNDGGKNEPKILELQDAFDELMVVVINPTWIKWGVKAVENLEDEDSRPLTVDDWADWPSELYQEILDQVKITAEMSGEAGKNSESPTTSDIPVVGSPIPSTAPSAVGEATIETETVASSQDE